MDGPKFTEAHIKAEGRTVPPKKRIVYDKKFLLTCRESRHSKTLPSDLPEIPGVTVVAALPINLHRQLMNGPEDRRVRPSTMRDSYPEVFKFDENVVTSIPPKMPMRAWEGAASGGPLAQYRRRQSSEGLGPEDGPMRPEQFFQPPLHHGFSDTSKMGVIHRNIIPANAPFIPPPVHVAHPLQGPSGLFAEHGCLASQMSKLSIWRKSHVRNEIPYVQGYTTAKTPSIRPLHNGGPSLVGSHRRSSLNEFRSSPIATPDMSTIFTNGRLIGDPELHFHHSINDAVPDDPSIIAYKPSRRIVSDSNHMLSPMSISF